MNAAFQAAARTGRSCRKEVHMEIEERLPLTDEYLKKMDAYWRAANYLGAAQLYLLDNPLLREPLKLEHVKKKIV